VQRLRARGVPVVGYTWWPMFALVAWSYRQGQRAIERHVLQMGLWDLDARAGLRRVRTAAVDAFTRVVAEGARLVGPLGRSGRAPQRARAVGAMGRARAASAMGKGG
jgi:hypothetical protein